MQAVKDTLAENLTAPFHHLGRSDFTIDEIPDLKGKTGVITGGSEGIGYGLTHTLLSKGISKLFITSRRQETGDEALKALEEELGAEACSRVVYIQNDQSDWRAAAKAASDIARQAETVDCVWLNSARGIMTRQLEPNSQTDQHMATNVAGHITFLSHLLPILKKTADQGRIVRVVILSSNLHESAPAETEFRTLEEWNKDYGPNAQYARTKLANLLHARYLHKHLHSSHPNILINATHPGIVDTAQTNVHIHEAYPLLGYGMSLAMAPFKKSQDEGAVSSLYAGTVCKESGQYITPPAIVEPGSRMGSDMELAERLMEFTRKLVEEKTRPESSQKGCPFKDY